jgi:hypothetical protein
VGWVAAWFIGYNFSHCTATHRAGEISIGDTLLL